MTGPVLYSDSGRQQKCSQSSSSLTIPGITSAQLLPPVETSLVSCPIAAIAGSGRPTSPRGMPVWHWLSVLKRLTRRYRSGGQAPLPEAGGGHANVRRGPRGVGHPARENRAVATRGHWPCHGSGA